MSTMLMTGSMSASTHPVRVGIVPITSTICHALVEPARDAAIDRGLEALEALLAGFLHAERSRLASASRSMQPPRPPGVTAEGFGATRRHLSRATAAARSPPASLPPPDSRAL